MKSNSISFIFLHLMNTLIGTFSYFLCNDSVFSSPISSFTLHIPPEFTKPEYSCMSSAQSYVRGKALESTAPVVQPIKTVSTLLNEIVLENTPHFCLIYIHSLVLSFASNIRVYSSNYGHILISQKDLSLQTCYQEHYKQPVMAFFLLRHGESS